MIEKISERMDKIANTLEEYGLIKEAYELDRIADQLDNMDQIKRKRIIHKRTTPIMETQKEERKRYTLQEMIDEVNKGVPPSLRAKREKFIKEHPPTKSDFQRHPDLRMVDCPPELLLDSEWYVSYNDDTILPYGSFYDPVNIEFIGYKRKGEDY